MDKIFVQSRVDGFRRCGVAHSAKGKEFPEDFFAPEELEILGTDPDIIMVAGVSGEDEPDRSPTTGSGTTGEGGGTELTLERLKAAAAKAVEDGNTISSGKPAVEAMEATLGCRIDSAQRDQGYEAFCQENPE